MRFIIEGYVNQIKSEDIIKFASSNNISISEEEALFLKELLKSHLDDVFEWKRCRGITNNRGVVLTIFDLRK